MYKTKLADGRNNICGKNIYALRKKMLPKVSQRIFAEKLQLQGVDLDKNAIQRIECGKRFVTDIELKAIAYVLGTTSDVLLREENDTV